MQTAEAHRGLSLRKMFMQGNQIFHRRRGRPRRGRCWVSEPWQSRHPGGWPLRTFSGSRRWNLASRPLRLHGMQRALSFLEWCSCMLLRCCTGMLHFCVADWLDQSSSCLADGVKLKQEAVFSTLSSMKSDK